MLVHQCNEQRTDTSVHSFFPVNYKLHHLLLPHIVHTRDIEVGELHRSHVDKGGLGYPSVWFEVVGARCCCVCGARHGASASFDSCFRLLQMIDPRSSNVQLSPNKYVQTRHHSAGKNKSSSFSTGNCKVRINGLRTAST